MPRKSEPCECCITDGDIRFCKTKHTYTHIPTDTPLTSVSKVIQTVYSTKSWDGVDPAVVENARVRGEMVDAALAEYVSTGAVSMTATADVTERLEIAVRLWDKYRDSCKLTGDIRSQHILYSVEYGIAGTADFTHDGAHILDLKTTYNTELSWGLQIGAYAFMLNGMTKQEIRSASIIHISPKVYKDAGGVIIPCDVDQCVTQWIEALIFWKRMKQFTPFKDRKK